MSDEVWLRSDDWVGTEVDDSYVMVNVESGKYVSLNETAAAIWRSLETPQGAQDIGTYLTERFDIAPEACTAAVADTLTQMRDLSLIATAAE